MRKKVTVLGSESECAQTLADRDYADVVVDDYVEMSGSDVVVASGDCDWTRVRVRAPNAVVLVRGDREAALRETLFPDERVVEVDRSTSTPELVELVESILFERRA